MIWLPPGKAQWFFGEGGGSSLNESLGFPGAAPYGAVYVPFLHPHLIHVGCQGLHLPLLFSLALSLIDTHDLCAIKNTHIILGTSFPKFYFFILFYQSLKLVSLMVDWKLKNTRYNFQSICYNHPIHHSPPPTTIVLTNYILCLIPQFIPPHFLRSLHRFLQSYKLLPVDGTMSSQAREAASASSSPSPTTPTRSP